MTKRTRQLALVLALILVAGIWLNAREAHTLPASKTGVIGLTSADHWVGGTLLPNGYYQIRCDHSGVDHELVFRKATVDHRGGERVGGEVARVKCKMEDLGQKAEMTTAFTAEDEGGKRKISAIIVRGERVRHIFN